MIVLLFWLVIFVNGRKQHCSHLLSQISKGKQPHLRPSSAISRHENHKIFLPDENFSKIFSSKKLSEVFHLREPMSYSNISLYFLRSFFSRLETAPWDLYPSFSAISFWVNCSSHIRMICRSISSSQLSHTASRSI